jgi:hypothetical protein
VVRDAIAGEEKARSDHCKSRGKLSRRYDPEGELRRLIAGIQGIAARAGRPTVYHETITRFAQSRDPG